MKSTPKKGSVFRTKPQWKSFQQWSISNFIDWGVNHTKEKFAVLIIDAYAYYKWH
jgi:hypothetical protein